MKPILLKLLLVVPALLLGGCVTIAKHVSKQEASGYVLPDDRTGLIVGSFIEKGFTSYIFGFGPQGHSGPSGGLAEQFFLNTPPPDMTRDGGTGRVFVIPVPAGKYQLTVWGFTLYGGPTSSYWDSKTPMNVPFEVKAGQATYIGEIASVPVYNSRGGLAGGYYKARAEKDRDLKILRQQYPVIRGMKVNDTKTDQSINRYFSSHVLGN